MPADFQYDVFLSHSAKDKAVVRVPSLSASNGERAGVRCRNLQLVERRIDFPTVAAQVGTCGRGNLSFRDPLNKERRFIPLRFDDAPIKGSLAQFLYINWRPANYCSELMVHANGSRAEKPQYGAAPSCQRNQLN